MTSIITYNLNGIRAAVSKGLIDWLSKEQADIVCLQETKAHDADIPKAEIETLGYYSYWFSAEKKGYSSVGVITKQKPLHVVNGNGYPMSDAEGRVITLYFETFILVCAYFPSGTSGDERQSYKYQWLDEFMTYIDTLQKESRKPLLICGDYNIAHHPIDIHNPVSNAQSSGFLPEERAWLTKFLETQGLIDSFRHLHPTKKDAYSWWSFRANARKNNKGWRIDYICVSKSLGNNIKSASIHPEVQHSDHCPCKILIDV